MNAFTFPPKKTTFVVRLDGAPLRLNGTVTWDIVDFTRGPMPHFFYGLTKTRDLKKSKNKSKKKGIRNILSIKI